MGGAKIETQMQRHRANKRKPETDPLTLTDSLALCTLTAFPRPSPAPHFSSNEEVVMLYAGHTSFTGGSGAACIGRAVRKLAHSLYGPAPALLAAHSSSAPAVVTRSVMSLNLLAQATSVVMPSDASLAMIFHVTPQLVMMSRGSLAMRSTFACMACGHGCGERSSSFGMVFPGGCKGRSVGL